MNTKGTIFDIQRTSIHDGPGIRTTVFLKGCYLNCIWCHNPESVEFERQISYNGEKCINCRQCSGVCKTGAQCMEAGQHIFRREFCTLCGECLKVCLPDAMKIIGSEVDVQSVLDVVVKDRKYYLASGGGLTVTGGEPMGQFDFLLNLLCQAKQQGIHTCLETSGYAPTGYFEKLLHVVDLFLFDYKATEKSEHVRLTGVSNELIVDNLNFLYNSNCSIILRCPLVPGINDSEAHLSGIAALCNSFPNLAGIEIMAYHDMGVAKNNNIGKVVSMTSIPTVAEDVKRQWLNTLKSKGCGKVKLG